MEIFKSFLLLFILIGTLILSADLLLDSFARVSQKLKTSAFIVGFVILGGISSLPELAVAINSSVKNVPGLAIGNLVGETLILLSLMIGLNAIKRGSLPFKGSYSTGSVVVTLFIISAMVLTLLDGKLTQLEGVTLLIAYLAGTLFIVKKASGPRVGQVELHFKLYKELSLGVVALVGLLLSSNFLVDTAVHLATLLTIPNALIGLLVLGLGTNLPELTLLMRSDGAEKNKLSVGNFLGSATINVPIMGMIALWRPGSINDPVVLLPAIVMLSLTMVLFGFFANSDKGVTKREGYALVGLFIVWVIVELAISLLI